MKRLAFSFIILVALIACTAADADDTDTSASATGDTTTLQPTISSTEAAPSPEPTEEPIGMLQLEENRVEHGAEIDTLEQILEDSAFFTNDVVRVSEGGEALLDFGDQMIMRLFNDTEMEVVSAETASDVPWEVRFFLHRGGFTGQLTEEGGQAIYETPGGTQIIILGTEYFVVYDPSAGTTAVGNFAGSVEVIGDGETLILPDGYFVTVPDNEPPNPPQPLPISQTEFEQNARDVQSPVQVANEAGVWSLAMSWEWLAFPEFERVLTSVTWSGKFQIEGDQIVGQGTGTIDSPPPAENEIITVAGGSFQFDVGGVVRTDNNGNPIFEIEIQGYNSAINIEELKLNCEAASRNCEDVKLLVTRILQVLAEELHTVTKPIVIDAEHGATAMAELDGSQVTYPTVFDDEPMVGYEFQAPFIEVIISSANQQDN